MGRDVYDKSDVNGEYPLFLSDLGGTPVREGEPTKSIKITDLMTGSVSPKVIYKQLIHSLNRK